MKTSKYLAFIFVSVIMILTSCENNLDLYPPDKESSVNYWKNEDDLLRGVNATYRYVFPQDDAYGLDIFHLESATDNSYSQHSNQFGNFQQIALGAYESNHAAVKKMWDLRYECIRKCTEYLVNNHKVETDEDLRNRYTSEVLFQRAYAYYYLIALYGDVPWVDRLLTREEAVTIGRTDKFEIADQIIADLDTATKYLPSSYEDPIDDGRVTKWAAASLKSRICLLMAGDYRENPNSKYWEQAAEAARLVWKSGAHRLNYVQGDPVGSYSRVFYERDMSNPGSEVIYEAQFTTEERPLFGFTMKLACVSDGGWNSWTPTQDMIDAYGMKTSGKYIDEEGSGYDTNDPFKDRDPRLTASCYYSGCTTLKGLVYNSQPQSGSPDRMDQHNGTKTGYGWRKYLDEKNLGMWDSGNDFPLIRLSEIVLNFAEAQNEVLAAPDNDVRSAVNYVRNRVGMPSIPTGLSKDAMREVIRRERRVELAFEGTRFFDIRRWKIAHEVMNKDNGWILGMVLDNPGNYIVNEKGQVRANVRTFNKDKHYLWPIPLREVELNKNLLPNNPGWN